jgi:hypothetical protein
MVHYFFSIKPCSFVEGTNVPEKNVASICKVAPFIPVGAQNIWKEYAASKTTASTYKTTSCQDQEDCKSNTNSLEKRSLYFFPITANSARPIMYVNNINKKKKHIVLSKPYKRKYNSNSKIHRNTNSTLQLLSQSSQEIHVVFHPSLGTSHYRQQTDFSEKPSEPLFSFHQHTVFHWGRAVVG